MFRAIRPSTLYRASALYKNAAVPSPARASMAMNFARMYSAGAGLARSDVEKRVLDILAGFNKVDAKKDDRWTDMVTPVGNGDDKATESPRSINIGSGSLQAILSISLQANFNADLGLDSLDTVEVVMAIEEEFSIEIPDKDADEIKSAEQAVEYISKRDDAH
ncbi:hypothetical protein BG003_010521 [Podila horticola]|nr:hypothetical protein BG003_010521 [Podila horticola]